MILITAEVQQRVIIQNSTETHLSMGLHDDTLCRHYRPVPKKFNV
jgi:hypothetical protein